MTTEQIQLPISGMTCASCATRVEKKLNGIKGVTATVNLATETAAVDFDPDAVAPAELVTAVESLGYGASLPSAHGHHHEDLDDRALASLRARVAVSALLALPVLVLGMVPAFDGRGWEWISLVLATPVVTWGAWPIHQATWINLRHRATTMDTLISLGVAAAYLWSLAVLLTDADNDVYFEVAAVVTVLVLLGRYLEAREAARRVRAPSTVGSRRQVRLGSRRRRTRARRSHRRAARWRRVRCPPGREDRH